jgi:shikimate dehydrogenase
MSAPADLRSAGRPRILDGATRLYGIIGDPIAQVRSPEVVTARLRRAGRNAILVPFHVAGARFDETVRGLKALANLDGLVVTVPYKARILSHVDTLLANGMRVGAINAMRREKDGSWTGDNFDGRGLVHGLRERGHAVAGTRVAVIGCGGAGSAVAVAFAEEGAAALSLCDADERRAQDLARRVAEAFPDCALTVAPPDPAGRDILVNATPVGMAPGDGLPVPLGPLDPRLLVIDVVMKPAVTPLLRHAEACGCRTVPGRVMLEGQVEELIRFFGIAEEARGG